MNPSDNENVTLPSRPFEDSTMRDKHGVQIGELHQLINALKNPLHKVVAKTLSLTGMRVGELCSLRESDVDLSFWQVIHVKGKSRYARLIPISVSLQELLMEYKLQRGKVSPQDRFFRDLSQRKFSVDLTQASKRVGLQGITSYVFRENFAQCLLKTGVGLPIIQSIMGVRTGEFGMFIPQPCAHFGYQKLLDAVLKMGIKGDQAP